MASQIHLRLIGSPDEEGSLQPRWLRIQPGQTRAEMKQGDLTALTYELNQEPAQVNVYVPGRDVLITQVSLPDSNRKNLISALPYALEDNLLDDIDKLHFVLGPKISNGQYIAIVINKQKMQTWIDMLRTNDIQPRSLLPDYLLSPTDETSWCIYCENTSVLVRTGLNQGFTCNRQNLLSFLQKLLSDTETRPQQIKAYHCQSLSTEERTLLESTLTEYCELEFLEAPEHVLAMIMHSQYQASEINLLQGDYKNENPMSSKLKPWRSVAALAAIWLVFVMAMDVTEYFRLQNQNEMLDQEIIQVFRETFPEVKRVDRHKVQVLMRQNLAKMRGRSNKKGASFEEMLAKIGPLTRSSKNMTIQQLRYQNGRMEVLLELPDLQTLESFKQTLTTRTPWQIELKTANASDNKVQGRILIHSQS